MGILYIVATPIGNLDDITIRAQKILGSVDYIACEDTRRTGQLLHSLHITPPKFLRYDDRNEQNTTPEILDLLESGKSVALVSDAGTPLISDPGFVIVREARKRGIPVVSIPGASALLTALTGSGLPANKFMYLGYPPEKQSHRLKLFGTLPKEITVIFYCAPHKLQSMLVDMKETLGDIKIVIARELTKIHEEYWKGNISEAIVYFADPKGEFVVCFSLL